MTTATIDYDAYRERAKLLRDAALRDAFRRMAAALRLALRPTPRHALGA